MTRRLIVSYLLITVFTLLVLEIPLGRFIARFELARIETGFERNASVLATIYEDALDRNEPYDPRHAAEYAADAGVRVVIVDDTGTSIIDTDEPANQDFSNRPEIEAALAGERVADTRDSVTLGRPLSYVAVPVASGGEVHGAVRITFNPKDLANRIENHWRRLIAVGAVVLAAVAAVGWIIARSVTKPLRAMQEAAVSMGGGDLSRRIDSTDAPPEVAALADGFNTMAARLDALLARQRRFVSDASHELRTPLTALRLRLENVMDEANEGQLADLEAALAETDRLSELVSHLLTIARAEDGTVELEPTDLITTARDRVGLWEAVAEEAQVELRFESASVSATVHTVPGSIDQIVDNLVSNAIGASGPDGKVLVSVASDSDHAQLIVEDTGAGMPADDRARAFDRFWRADHHSPGTGLGLAIVRELAEAGGGTADLGESSSGGIRATVTFPY